MGQNDLGMRRYISLEFRAECDATFSHALLHSLPCSGVHLPSSDPDLELRLVAYLNPLSPGAQQLAPLIQTLYTATSVSVDVYLNPVGKISAVPIKRFVCLSIFISIYLCVALSVCLSVHLSVCCVCQAFFCCYSFYRFVMEPELSFEEDGR